MHYIIDFNQSLSSVAKRQLQRTDTKIIEPESEHVLDDLDVPEFDTLGKLVDFLATGDWNGIKAKWNSQFQEQIGRQLFQRLDRALQAAGLELDQEWLTGGELTLITNDELLDRAPWSVLSRNGKFLVDSGWNISLAHPDADWREILHPVDPVQMLIVMPNPYADKPNLDTDADAHLAELREVLGKRVNDAAWHVVRNVRELRQRLDTEVRSIDCVYYYGHGDYTGGDASLVFEGSGGPDFITINLFAKAIRESNSRPSVAYLNCCYGNAAFNLGAGKQLGDAVPFVLTNRTVAMVTAARSQATAFWRKLLVDRVPPHQAAGDLYRLRLNLDLDISDARWMTPVPYRGYHQWSRNRRSEDDLDPDWREKLDRIPQTGAARLLIDELVRDSGSNCVAFCWYGGQRHGVDRFGSRLRNEIKHQMRHQSWHVQIPWPQQIPASKETNDADLNGATSRVFCEMLCSILQINDILDLPSIIRQHFGGYSENMELLLLIHESIKQAAPRPTMNELREYLYWWDELLSNLEPKQKIVLGLPFVIDDPGKFGETILQIEHLPLRHILVEKLDVLRALDKGDLKKFFRRLRRTAIRFTEDELEKIIDKIILKTQGEYERVVQELEKVLEP